MNRDSLANAKIQEEVWWRGQGWRGRRWEFLGLGVLGGRAMLFADGADVRSKRSNRVQHGSSYGSGLSDRTDGVSLTEWPMGEKLVWENPSSILVMVPLRCSLNFPRKTRPWQLDLEPGFQGREQSCTITGV